jgi:hypothetical protein
VDQIAQGHDRQVSDDDDGAAYQQALQGQRAPQQAQ